MKKYCLTNILYIGGYHLLLAIALPIYFYHQVPSLGMIITTISLVFLSGMAITAGYHRLYSHSCYKVHPFIEYILLFFGTLATQGSVLKWAHDHRLHHSHVDTDKDPYSVKKGLLHAHILWMFYDEGKIDMKVISDLSKRKILMFQHRYYGLCMVATNVLTFLAVGWFFSDYLTAFIFAWWVRLFLLHHTTWCINSLAHYYGTQNYSQEHSAVDNYLISLLTYGEGYHNYHHTFAYDYRNGIRWYHFDPAKWLIWSLHKVGLAYNLKRVNDYRIARHLLLQHKDELVKKLKKSAYVQKVSDLAENLSLQLSEMQKMLEPKHLKAMKNSLSNDWKDQVRELKKSIKSDWKKWRLILKEIQKEHLLKS